MNTSTLRILMSVFLIAHGLVTMSLATVPVPKPGALHTPYFPAWWRADVDTTWPISRLGLTPNLVRAIGWILWVLALIPFVAAVVSLSGFLGVSALWQPLAAIAAGLSLILLGLYWHPWLILGVLINLGILACVYAGWFTRWLSR